MHYPLCSYSLHLFLWLRCSVVVLEHGQGVKRFVFKLRASIWRPWCIPMLVCGNAAPRHQRSLLPPVELHRSGLVLSPLLCCGRSPVLSICALAVNLRPMTIDERGDVVGRAVLDFGVVILAAGASSRMGKPKLLLPWGVTSVLGHLIGQWKAMRAGQIATVWASGDQAVSAELDRLDFPRVHRVVNPTPERGMFSSIQCAARWGGWNAELTHWTIALGDQPHLRPDTLRALLHFAGAQSNQVCQPSPRGRPRHPV